MVSATPRLVAWMAFDLRFTDQGVPRILEGTLPPHLSATGNEDDWEPFAEYMANTRVNINVRQVFPRGYDLSQLQSSSS